MASFKKNLALIGLTFFLAAFAFFAAARDLEIQYPTIPGVTAPVSTKAMLPDYVEYIFKLAIGISGLVALSVLIYAGFSFLAAAGNPSKMGDAKDRIFDALIGILVLLGSYLLLTTINPQLVMLPGEIARSGIELHTDAACNGDAKKGTAWYTNSSVSDISSVARSMNFNSIKYLSSPSAVDVFVYPQKNFEPDGQGINPAAGGGGNCYLLSLSPQSIKLDWKTPGVYLYQERNYSGSPKITMANIPKLEQWNDKVQSIKLKSSGEIRFGAVLHEDNNYEGECKVFREDSADIDSVGNGVSSVTVFPPTNETYGAGLTLCKNPDCEPGEIVKNGKTVIVPFKYGPTTASELDLEKSGLKYPETDELINDNILAIQIEGNYMVALFRGANYQDECQLFFQSFPNLKRSRVMDNSFLEGLEFWEKNNSVSSLKIIPIRK